MGGSNPSLSATSKVRDYLYQDAFSGPSTPRLPALRSGFRLRAPAPLTPANRLKLKRAASKAAIPERVSGVRIPPSPPSKQLAISNQRSALSQTEFSLSRPFGPRDSGRIMLFGDANLGLLQNVSDGGDHSLGCFKAPTLRTP